MKMRILHRISFHDDDALADGSGHSPLKFMETTMSDNTKCQRCSNVFDQRSLKGFTKGNTSYLVFMTVACAIGAAVSDICLHWGIGFLFSAFLGGVMGLGVGIFRTLQDFWAISNKKCPVCDSRDLVELPPTQNQ